MSQSWISVAKSKARQNISVIGLRPGSGGINPQFRSQVEDLIWKIKREAVSTVELVAAVSYREQGPDTIKV